MSKDPQPQKTGFGWWRFFKWCGLGLFLVSFLLVASFFILVVHTCMIASSPPAPMQTTANLLLKRENSVKSQIATHSHPPFSSSASASPRPPAATTALDVATSATHAAGEVFTLVFEPFIPDTSDLPGGLRAKRDLLNARLDKVMREIEAFEHLKKGLDDRQAGNMMSKIDKDFRDAWKEIEDDCSNRPLEGGYKKLWLRYVAYEEWWWSWELDVLERRQNWNMAAGYAQNYLIMRRSEWEVRNYNGPAHYFRSDFYGAGGMTDWRRGIYYYRQQGGWRGYASIVSSVYLLEKEQFVDYIDRKTLAILNPGILRTGAEKPH